jgi:CheY-like chemotaxis protein
MSAEPHDNTVLIVDDNLDLCASLASLVMLEGYNAATATNGAAALRYLAEHAPPRFIVLDMMMPVMDGPTFLARKRETPGLAPIPVFVYTGYEEVLDLDHYPDVVCVVRKPVDPDILVNTMRRYG